MKKKEGEEGQMQGNNYGNEGSGGGWMRTGEVRGGGAMAEKKNTGKAREEDKGG